MLITQRKSEPHHRQTNLGKGSAYPVGHHWSKAALFEYDHKSFSEQAVLPDAAGGDRRGKLTRIADSPTA